MKYEFAILLGSLSTLSIAGCNALIGNEDEYRLASGGTAGTGGASASGGSDNSGGRESGGGASTGGASSGGASTGGTLPTGGTAGAGGSVDPDASTAGGSQSGGAGGTVSSGGTAGAGGASTGGTAASGGTSTGGAGTGGAGGSLDCQPEVKQQPSEGADHTPNVCDPVTYVSNPPSSGSHYGVWAQFKTYTVPVPEGFWVHDLEHGAVVLTYNCPSGCADEVAAAQAMINKLPPDDLCTQNPAPTAPLRRIVMTPDPKLTTRWAASAWTWTLRAKCFDPVAFAAFIGQHYGHGPEDLCDQGDPNVPGGFPSNCGEP